MNRFWSLIIPIVLLGCNTKEARVEERRPNVILIMADDQGWGDLSYHGNSNLSTPNIDRIAENGVTFENFYVQPVCSPSRAELLTGRHFVKLGVYSTSTGGERLNLDETTLAEVFQSAGYPTAIYGKWHNGMQPPYHPNARGFSDFYGFASGHWGNYFNPLLEHNGKLVDGKGYLPDDLTDHGLQFIEENKEQPFFLFLPYNTPHSPMQVPDAYWNKFEGKEFSKRHYAENLEDFDFTRAALAMVENIDYNVGRIAEKIKSLDLEEETIMVYLSDNGPNSWRWNAAMRGRKGSVDEGGVRSPFFVQWRGMLPEGKVVKQIAATPDIFPTLCDLAGIEAKTEKSLDGQSLRPLLLEDQPSWPARTIVNYWGGKISLRTEKHRLDDDNRLYNMINDRGQKTDISTSEKQLTDSLVRLKEDWVKRYVIAPNDRKFRPFTVGHPDFEFTQLPARDGTAHGNIIRSNRYPNCSYFTNWTASTDSIKWEIEVLGEGEYEVEIYYTCQLEDLGSNVVLEFEGRQLSFDITEGYNPPEIGMENDRVPRIESYVKDFRKLNAGSIYLKKGSGALNLHAPHIPGKSVMDLRLINLVRKTPKS